MTARAHAGKCNEATRSAVRANTRDVFVVTLGGPDTAGRAQLSWQVRILFRPGGDQTPDELLAATDIQQKIEDYYANARN